MFTAKGFLVFLQANLQSTQFILPLPLLSVICLQCSHPHDVICVLSSDSFPWLLLSLLNLLLYPCKVSSTVNKLHHKLFLRTFSSMADVSETWPSPRHLESLKLSQLEVPLSSAFTRATSQWSPLHSLQYSTICGAHVTLYPSLCLSTTSLHVIALQLREICIWLWYLSPPVASHLADFSAQTYDLNNNLATKFLNFFIWNDISPPWEAEFWPHDLCLRCQACACVSYYITWQKALWQCH